MAKKGLLLVNLGTPDAPNTPAVRKYLREFLSDPHVLDIHPVGRFLLLNLVILPTRPQKSAVAYRKIWTDRGSPLLFHSQDLTRKVQERLAADYETELGMRYGSPSIPDALASLKARGIEDLTVLPLYPQYADSSSGSTIDKVKEVLAGWSQPPPVKFIQDFFDHPGFLDAFATVARPVVSDLNPDHVLFSFHGLPERHVTKLDKSGQHCLSSPSCCDAVREVNRLCYRAQSYATARGIAERLGLSPDRFTVSFQSRLGRTPWIKPYTDLVLPELLKKGHKRVAVVCPSFVADCLETLEEIGIRARESFEEEGGEKLVLVPSVNAEPQWVDTVCSLVTGTTQSPA